jgi:hypothetical protein
MKKTSVEVKITIGIIITLVVLFLIGSYSGEISDKVSTTLGATGNVGNYAVKTSGHNQVVSAVPIILHKIIIGTANDAISVANSTTTPSTNGAFKITATVPQTFDMEMILNQGLVANVTSSSGAVFIYSPY